MIGADGGYASKVPREASLARTFVELADTLVADFDVVDTLALLVERCVTVLGVDAAGLMLAADDSLHVMYSSSDASLALEEFQIKSGWGPCLDCYRRGTPVVNQDLAEAGGGRWPRFATEAMAAGFRAVHALPMRLRDSTIGALNLFHAEAGLMTLEDVGSAQAFADVATIAILQHRAASDAQALNEQLSIALQSRVIIEQAKGVVSASIRTDMEDAFARLRHYARANRLRLTDLARQIVAGEVMPKALE